MSLFTFSRPVRKSSDEELRAQKQIDTALHKKEALMYKNLYQEQLDKQKPVAPLGHDEYCQKMARLKRELDAHKNAHAGLCSEIIRAAFCDDLGTDYEYQLVLKIVQLKMLIAQANILSCELTQQSCDLANADAQIQACCDEVICRVEGKDVSSDTYQGLMQCVLVKC